MCHLCNAWHIKKKITKADQNLFPLQWSPVKKQKQKCKKVKTLLFSWATQFFTHFQSFEVRIHLQIVRTLLLVHVYTELSHKIKI